MPSDMDVWWARQSWRRPHKYQVWTAEEARVPQVLVFSTDDPGEALREARRAPYDRIVWVLPPEPGEPYLRRSRAYTNGNYRWTGPLAPDPDEWHALKEEAWRLSNLKEPRRLGFHGLSVSRARRIANMLRVGVLHWRNREEKVRPVELVIERSRPGGRMQIRRVDG